MKVQEKRTDDLVPYEQNPRHNDGAVDAVAASIKEFGFKVPIVIDKDNVVVAGHTRLKAADQLGIETVPCIVADDLTDEQIKAFRLADNKTAEMAEWDFEKLIPELKGIEELNMEAFGFDDGFEEEEYYLKKQNKAEAEKIPGSRVIVASLSVFGGGAEVFCIKQIDQEDADKILANMTEETASLICDKIETAIKELMS